MTTDGRHRLDTTVGGKSAMLTLSLQLERFAARLATAGPQRPQVLCLFQHAAYFERARARFTRLAEVADVVVAHAGPSLLPTGITWAPLEPDEPLAAEWTVVVIGATSSTAMVATETGGVVPARTVERARAFRYEATHLPRRVELHTIRVLTSLGQRLGPSVHSRIANAARAVPSGSPDSSPATVALHAQLQRSLAAVDAASTVTVPHALTGLELTGSLEALALWRRDAGPRAPVLPAVAVRAPGALETVRPVARRLRPAGGLVVAATPDDLVVVLPRHDDAEVARVARGLGAAAATATDAPRVHVGTFDARIGSLDALLLALDVTPVGVTPPG